MDLEEFRRLDPEEVAARCGGSQPADDGPNPGTAGDKEATVADNEHTEDPADGDVDPTEASVDVERPAPEEPEASGDAQEDADGNAPNYRKAQLRASALVQRLQEADPTKSDEECLALLVGLSEMTSKPQQQITMGQFVTAELEDQVNFMLNLHPPGQAVDADDASGDLPAADDANPGEDLRDAEEALTLDQLIERAKLELKLIANQAYQLADDKYRRQLVESLADQLWKQAYIVYRAAGWDDERIEAQLCKGSDGSVIADPEKKRFMWYQRTAFAMIRQEDKTPEQFLAEFNFPGLAPRRKQRRSKQEQSMPDVPPRPPREAEPHAKGDDPEAGDEQPAGEAGAEPQPDASEADVAETGPSPIDVNEVDGRRVVYSGEQPSGGSRVVKGGGAKMKPPVKAGGIVARPAEDQSPSDVQRVDKSQPSDESILANLPDNIIEAAITSVLEDPDPAQCWAYRTPEEVRVEADRRLLLEYRAASAA